MGGIFIDIIRRGVDFDKKEIERIWGDILSEEEEDILLGVLNGIPEEVKNSRENIERYLKADASVRKILKR